MKNREIQPMLERRTLVRELGRDDQPRPVAYRDLLSGLASRQATGSIEAIAAGTVGTPVGNGLLEFSAGSFVGKRIADFRGEIPDVVDQAAQNKVLAPDLEGRCHALAAGGAGQAAAGFSAGVQIGP